MVQVTTRLFLDFYLQHSLRKRRRTFYITRCCIPFRSNMSVALGDVIAGTTASWHHATALTIKAAMKGLTESRTTTAVNLSTVQVI